MKQVNHKDPCVPMAATCVKWVDGEIDCIKICSDDSIEDVVVKLGAQTCSNTSNLDLSTLDITPLLNNCVDCTDTTKTLLIVLRLCIQNIEDLKNEITTIKNSL